MSDKTQLHIEYQSNLIVRYQKEVKEQKEEIARLNSQIEFLNKKLK
jgi:polyhydroxyalkanoate synthesis regulator phasin